MFGDATTGPPRGKLCAMPEIDVVDSTWFAAPPAAVAALIADPEVQYNFTADDATVATLRQASPGF